MLMTSRLAPLVVVTVRTASSNEMRTSFAAYHGNFGFRVHAWSVIIETNRNANRIRWDDCCDAMTVVRYIDAKSLVETNIQIYTIIT